MRCRYLPRAAARPRCTPHGGAAAGAGVTVGVLGPTQRQPTLAVRALGAGTEAPGELVDARWEQAPASAINTVHKHVRAPRAVLEPGRGVTRPPTGRSGRRIPATRDQRDSYVIK